MATYTGLQSGRAIHASEDCGNTWLDSNKITPSVALVAADVLAVLQVPAGTRLETLRYRAGDFDTGATLVFNLGYRTRLAGGTATNLTFFGTGITTLQAATTAWQELVFDSIKFDEPVDIVATVTAGAAGVSGTPSFYSQALGVVIGIT
jgi:hypothetical protein